MKVLVKSIYDAFQWVQKQQQDPDAGKYAVISIQDSHTGGFGIRFTENARCTGVLTLLVDDIVKEIEGLTLFDAEMADAVIGFIEAHKDMAIRIPMSEDTRLRSFNLANSANIILFEALRQLDFPGLA